MIQIKRVYESSQASDGMRILVDRLWPRGMSKEKAKLSLWLKDIAPSDDLRKWFGHDPQKWKEFQKKYKEELQKKKMLLAQLKQLEKKNKIITLVYGAKDTKHNEAVVLVEILTQTTF